MDTANWWKGGVIYQIYPRSFQDSNNDGIGDLNGITARLDYIASLGVDAIWISPFFKSPMKDFGYDVCDYFEIDPIFGTLADFDRLREEAHRREIKIIGDLVLSHTSEQHPWFMESRQARNNPKSDWYVWADPKEDGTVPNNWLSIFGGSAWQWDARRCQYYLHNFLSAQPDLNFHNRDVQDMMLTIADFWLARGMDGFRLDTINFYFHDEALTDNPPLPANLRNAKIAPAVNPYNYQDHLYDRNRPENIAFLERLRAVMDKYPGRAALGEVGDALRGLDIIADYTKGSKRIHMCYAFDFLAPEKLTADKITTVISNFTERAQGSWPCWAFSNHDVMRQASRLTDASKNQTSQIKQLAGLLLALTGSLCLYQGEELGLTEADIPFTGLKDPYGAEFWPEYKGRDGCRTPMVWEANTPNSGFSEALQCWLPVDKNHQALAVSCQEDDDGSVLNWYKKAIFTRRHNHAMRCGDMVFFDTNDAEILGFWRVLEEARMLCLFNFSDKPKKIPAMAKNHQIILSQHCRIDSVSGDLVLDGFGMLWGEKNK